MHYLSKGLIICNALLFMSFYAFSQNKVIGTWEAQKYTESCWAASLSNLANTWWNKKGLNQDSLYQEVGAGIDINDFEFISESNFKHRKVIGDSILTYQGINEYLKYPFNRPLIYSYNFEVKSVSYEGHFVNIVGCANSKLQYPNNYWIKIFDPKPDSIGTTYFKNYEAYRRIDSNKNSLQGTFFNFVDSKFNLPKLFRDSTTRELLDRKVAIIKDTCNSCLSDNSSLLRNLKSILSDSIFFEQLSNKVVFKTNWKIPITNIENPKDLVSELSTAENVKKSFLIITYDSTFQLKGGVVLKKIGKKLLIERVEDICRYKNFQSVFEKPNARLIIAKDQFKFVRYTEGKTLKFADIDNLFGNNKSNKVEIYNLNEVSEKLKPHYFKITESGLKLIKACQNLVLDTETCYRPDNQEHCTTVDVLSAQINPFLNVSQKQITFRVNYVENPQDQKFGFSLLWVEGKKSDNVGENDCKICFRDSVNINFPREYKEYSGSDYLFFVPVEKYFNFLNKLNLNSGLSEIEEFTSLGINPKNIKNIGDPRLENMKGFSGQRLELGYNSFKSPVGIICDVILKSNENKPIPCYLLNHTINHNIELGGSIKWKE